MSGGIVRVNKRGSKHYFVASNTPFNDESLSWGARGLMGYLLSKPDGWETRNSDLIAKGPAGEHKIKRMLKELKSAGYMHRYRRNSGGGLFDWITEIYERPDLNPHWQPQGDNHPMVVDPPSGDYPSMAEPSMDQPSMDNRPIKQILNGSNTDQSNTYKAQQTTKGRQAVVDVGALSLEEEKSNAPLPSAGHVPTAVADWIGFVGDIGAEMQAHNLSHDHLLAWGMWLRVDGRKCQNPVGVCRSKWRGTSRRAPQPPPTRWVELAQAWLTLDDDGRRALLSSGGQSYLLPEAFPYPHITAAFADLHKATSGNVLPDALLPEWPEAAPEPEPEAAAEPEELAVGGFDADLNVMWESAVNHIATGNSHLKTWLIGTRLYTTPQGEAVIQVGNTYAAEWINGRLLPLINREWQAINRLEASAYADLPIAQAVDGASLVLSQ